MSQPGKVQPALEPSFLMSFTAVEVASSGSSSSDDIPVREALHFSHFRVETAFDPWVVLVTLVVTVMVGSYRVHLPWPRDPP